MAISRAPLDKRFLLYLPSAKPTEPDNWLLDLLLAGHEFKADRASLDIQEAGLTLEFKELAQQHKAFFRSPVRTNRLKEWLRPNDDQDAVRLKMLAMVAKQQTAIDQLLLHAFAQLKDPANPEGADPVEALYGNAQLSASFWEFVKEKFGYDNPEPNLRDFAVALFNTVWSYPDSVNRLIGSSGATLAALRSWGRAPGASSFMSRSWPRLRSAKGLRGWSTTAFSSGSRLP